MQTRAETIYVCADYAPGYKKDGYEGGYHSYSGWNMIGWMTTPGEYISPTYYYPTEWGKK
jgi:hypothetical protein